MANAEREPAVRNTRLLEHVGDVALFRAEWHPDADLIRQLREIDVTVVESVGTAEHWRFEVRTEDRETFARFRQAFEDQGIPISLDRLYDLEEVLGDAGGPVTPKQREAVLAAYRRGYFDSPRGVSQEELADQFDVSRRAVSERLRRGLKNPVVATLSPGAARRTPTPGGDGPPPGPDPLHAEGHRSGARSPYVSPMETPPATHAKPVHSFEWAGDETPVHAVVRAVADARETDPTRIDPRFEAVDPDALEGLLARPTTGVADTDAVVRFEYMGFDVALHDDGGGFLFEAGSVDDTRDPT